MTIRAGQFTIVMAALMFAILGGPARAEDSVLTFHNSTNRHGEYVVPGLTDKTARFMHMDPAFTATYNGNVYAQPLYWAPLPNKAKGWVIVATATNLVEALDADTGAIVWQTQLPAAAPDTALQCGSASLAPEGITGTPAIDPVTGTIYLDAVTGYLAANVQHRVYALSANTGKVRPGWPLDVQAALKARGIAFDPRNQDQRGAVLFLNGSVYLAYGGLPSGCGNYHGIVVQVTPGPRPAVTAAWTTRDPHGGISGQGGAASDGISIYVTTGASQVDTAERDGVSIIRLRKGLVHSLSTRDFFKPADWQTLDGYGLDLGGTTAIPFSAAVAGGGPNVERLIAFGEDGYAYLTDHSNLGGIGGQLAVQEVSEQSIITAPAIYNPATSTTAMVVFPDEQGLQCLGGSLTMLSITPTATPISQAWCAQLKGNGSPIITTTNGHAHPIVWVAGAVGDNLLHGFDALTGQVVFGGGNQPMQYLEPHTTILAANRHLYVAGHDRLFAFTFIP